MDTYLPRSAGLALTAYCAYRNSSAGTFGLSAGGGDFIGSSLAVALADAGYAVTCFDNLTRRGSEILLGKAEQDSRTIRAELWR